MIWEVEMPDEQPGMQTPINMTNHAYWNLSGDFKQRSIADHTLQINASKMLEFNDVQIPSGEIISVVDTPFDFNNFEVIADKNRLSGAIDGGGRPGIDHAFVVTADPDKCSTMTKVATLRCGSRKMDVITT